jgi:hypothetical protein
MPLSSVMVSIILTACLLDKGQFLFRSKTVCS